MKIIKSTLTAIALVVAGFVSFNAQAQLVIEPSSNYTPEELVQVLVGEGVNVSNVTINCGADAYGVFNAENTTLPLSNGLILTSGTAVNAIGPNNSGSQTGSSGFAGDADLDLVTTAPTNDACVLEFDFTPYSDELSFNYVFGSEEYLEYAESTFNDVFAFFVTGPNPAGGTYNNVNIALIPGTSIPVSINTIHDAYEPNGVAAEYPEYYINNGDGFEVDPESTIQYDGLTTTLAAFASVVPCQSYHLKIAIADAGDSAFDSGVFLEAGSLSTNFVEVSANAVSIDGNATAAVEGCINAAITFTATNPATEDLEITFTLAGSATEGTDYQAVSHTVVIPEGQTSVSVPLNIIEDDVTEGNESIIVNFTLDVACEAFDQTASIDITDVTPLTITTDNTTIDAGQLVQLQAVGGGGNYSWTPTTGLGNPTVANPVASPLQTTTYTVTSNVGTCVLTDQVTITVQACDPATQVVAGTTALSDPIVCANANVVASSPNAVLFAGDVVGFALHASPTDDLIANPNSILALTTGTFSNNGTYAYNTPYYITPIAADNDGNGLPNLTDECLAVGTAAQVVFLSPITFVINEFCDWLSTGNYTVTAYPEGGYPAYDAATLYNISGDANEQLAAGQSVTIIYTTDQTPNIYSFTATDNLGCSGSVSNSFPLCIKTPIELLSFTGEVLSTGNQLKWTTATESNNDFYTLARSTDGINFNNIGTVQGAGNSSVAANYEFLDKTAPNGLSYYRLSQTDFSGLTTNVGTVALTRGETLTGFGIVQLYPVPVKETATVAINTTKAGVVTAQLFDITGKLAATQTINATEGFNTFNLSLNNLSAGVYVLTITNGTDIANVKVIKQ